MTAADSRRVRFRFSKLGKVRFTGHRDVARMWERALRRSGLPVAWSAGFSPHPLISFGLALPTGAESLGEYLDVTLEAAADPVDPAWTVRCLTDLLPEGVDVQAVAPVAAGSGSLQQEVSSCGWKLEVLGLSAGELATRVERLLDAPSVVVQRQRKGRSVHDDVRAAVLALAVEPPPDAGTGSGAVPLRLSAELATQPRGVRPQELLEGLGPGLSLVRACRTHQWIERDGARREPLTMSGETPGAFAPHARGRVS